MAFYNPGQIQGTSIGPYSGSNPVQDPAPPADASYMTGFSREKPSSPPATSTGIYKLVCCGILVVIAAILVGSCVGIVIALTGNDDETTDRSVGSITKETPPPLSTAPSELVATILPTMSPTRSPTIAPIVSAKDETRCPEEMEEYNSCLRGLSSFDSSSFRQCLTDITQVLADEGGTCSDYSDTYCSSIEACNCQGCQDKFEDWFNCFFKEFAPSECLRECETTRPSPAPVQVTLAPTEPIDPCQAEYDQYQRCFAFLTDQESDECVACGNDVLSTTSRNSCAEYTADLCNGFSTCTSCGFCRDDLLAWADCQIDGDQCEFDCSTVRTDPPVPPPTKSPVDSSSEAPTVFTEDETPVFTLAPVPVEVTEVPSKAPVPSPTPAPEARVCDFEETSYQQCLNVRLSDTEADACVTCTNQVLQGLGGTQCNTVNGAFCSGFSACSSCGTCANLIVGWVDCQVVGPSCRLECDVDFTAPPTPAPEATKCPTKQNQYAACLVTNVASQDDRLACISCINDASGNALLDSCTSFEDSFCNSLSQCTMCDVCAEPATSYVDCLVSNSQCQLDCGGGTEPPECISEETTYQSCTYNLGSTRGSSCVDCYNTAVQAADLSTCGLFQSQFCSAFNLCDCGSCDDEMVDWLDCRLPRCRISC